MDNVLGPKPTNNSSEKADRPNKDKFLDLKGGTDVHGGIRCVGKVICDKVIKLVAIHTVLRVAWHR